LAAWGVGTDSSNVYAVGQYPYGLAVLDGPVLHYDGSSWSELDYFDGTFFYDICGNSRTDIFMAAIETPLFTGSIIHYDGVTFTRVLNDASTMFSGFGVMQRMRFMRLGRTMCGVMTEQPGISWQRSLRRSQLIKTLLIFGELRLQLIYIYKYRLYHYDGSTWSVVSPMCNGSWFNLWVARTMMFMLSAAHAYVIIMELPGHRSYSSTTST